MKKTYSVQDAVGAAGVLTGIYISSKKGYGMAATFGCAIALGIVGYFVGQKIEKKLNFTL